MADKRNLFNKIYLILFHGLIKRVDISFITLTLKKLSNFFTIS